MTDTPGILLESDNLTTRAALDALSADPQAKVLLVLKGTRAAQMLIGLVFVAAGFFGAKLFELTTLSCCSTTSSTTRSFF